MGLGPAVVYLDGSQPSRFRPIEPTGLYAMEL
jgi:hypothetical protein